MMSDIDILEIMVKAIDDARQGDVEQGRLLAIINSARMEIYDLRNGITQLKHINRQIGKDLTRERAERAEVFDRQCAKLDSVVAMGNHLARDNDQLQARVKELEKDITDKLRDYWLERDRNDALRELLDERDKEIKPLQGEIARRGMVVRRVVDHINTVLVAMLAEFSPLPTTKEVKNIQ